MDHLPRCHMVKFPRGTSAPTGSNRVSLPNFPKTTWPHFIIHAPARHGRYSLSTHCVVFLKEKLQMCRNCIIVAYHYYTTKRFGDSTMSYDHCNFLINFSTTPVRMESDFTDIVLDIWRWSECFLKKGQTTDLPNRTLTLRFPLGIFPKKKVDSPTEQLYKIHSIQCLLIINACTCTTSAHSFQSNIYLLDAKASGQDSCIL